MNENKTLLLVEDEALLAMTEKLELEKYGYAVKTVNTGEKAVEAVKTMLEIDLVLMDINLGDGIDGTQAAEVILRDHDIPIVFVSSHSEREIVEKTEKITSYGYVVKSSSITVLDASIKMAFKLFDARNRLQQKMEIVKATDDRFQLAMNELDGTMWTLDLNLRFTLSRGRGLVSLGLQPDQVVGMNLADFLQTNDPENVSIVAHQRALLGENINYEYTHNGLTFRTAVSPLKDLNGKIIGVAGIGTDVSQRIKTENALINSEEKFAKVFKGSPYPVMVIDTDNGCYTEVNDAMSQNVEYSREELVGKNAVELGILTLETELQARRLIEKCGHYSDLEISIKTKSGKSRFGSASGSIVEIDKHAYLIQTVIDITERKNAEEALRESEERYKLLHENAAIGIGVYSPDGIVLSYNNLAAKYMGGVPEDFIGRSIYELYPKNEADLFHKRLEEAAVSDHPLVYEDKISLPSGRRYFLSTLTKIADNNNHLLGIQILAQDITERKILEEELLRSEERFQYAMNASNDGLWDWNLETNDIYYSPRWKNIIGYDDHEIENDFSVWETTTDPEDVKKSWELQQKLIAKQIDRFIIEFKMKHKHGHWVDILSQAKAVFDNNGKAIRIVGTHTDITDRKSAEEALRESKQKTELLLNVAAEIIISIDSHGDIALLNDSGHRIFGYETPELVGKNWFDTCLPAEIREETKSFFHHLMNGKTDLLVTHENEVITKNGQRKTIFWHNYILKDNEGNGIGLFSSGEDITEFIKGQRLNEVLSSRIKLAMDKANIAWWEMDIQTGIVAFDRKKTDMLGYQAEDFSQYQDFIALVHPEDFKKTMDAMRNHFTGVTDKYEIEYRIRAKNEEYKYFHDIGSITDRDTAGNPIKVIGIVIDITERKKAEEALHKSEYLIKSVIHSTQDIVVFKDTNFIFRLANPAMCKISGKSEDEIIGKTDFDIFPYELAEKYRNDDKYVLESEQSINIEEEVLSYGSNRYMSTTKAPVLNEKNKCEGVVIIVRDITERKKAENKISTLLAEKELLLKEVHHRIKNNMNTVSSLLSIQSRNTSEPMSILALDDARNRIQSMSILYDKLYRSQDYTELSVKNYLSSVIDEVIANFPNSQIVKVEKEIQDFILDIKRLQSLGIIVNELITNIMKYAFKDSDKGLIIITVTKKNKQVAISVQDDGIGMPESVNFENSSGFGLQLVQGLTQQLDGTIRIERGNGTKVLLEFSL